MSDEPWSLILRAYSIIDNAYPNAPEGSLAGDWLIDSGVTTDPAGSRAEPPAGPSEAIPEIERLKAENASLMSFEKIAAWANDNGRAVVALDYLHDLTKRAVDAESENASLLESLRAVENEGITVPWDATPEQMAFIGSLAGEYRVALAAAEKERDETRRSADGIAGELANWRAMADRNTKALAAAEQRAEAAEKALRAAADALRSDAVRFELASVCARNSGRPGDAGQFTAMQHDAAGWEAAARAALHDEERSAPPQEEKCVRCGHGRDAEHEIALKKAHSEGRAEALRQAAAGIDDYALQALRAADLRAAAVAKTLAGSLRALLEEAGK